MSRFYSTIYIVFSLVWCVFVSQLCCMNNVNQDPSYGLGSLTTNQLHSDDSGSSDSSPDYTTPPSTPRGIAPSEVDAFQTPDRRLIAPIFQTPERTNLQYNEAFIDEIIKKLLVSADRPFSNILNFLFMLNPLNGSLDIKKEFSKDNTIKNHFFSNIEVLINALLITISNELENGIEGSFFGVLSQNKELENFRNNLNDSGKLKKFDKLYKEIIAILRDSLCSYSGNSVLLEKAKQFIAISVWYWKRLFNAQQTQAASSSSSSSSQNNIPPFDLKDIVQENRLGLVAFSGTYQGWADGSSSAAASSSSSASSPSSQVLSFLSRAKLYRRAYRHSTMGKDLYARNLRSVASVLPTSDEDVVQDNAICYITPLDSDGILIPLEQFNSASVSIYQSNQVFIDDDHISRLCLRPDTCDASHKNCKFKFTGGHFASKKSIIRKAVNVDELKGVHNQAIVDFFNTHSVDEFDVIDFAKEAFDGSSNGVIEGYWVLRHKPTNRQILYPDTSARDRKTLFPDCYKGLSDDAKHFYNYVATVYKAIRNFATSLAYSGISQEDDLIQKLTNNVDLSTTITLDNGKKVDVRLVYIQKSANKSIYSYSIEHDHSVGCSNPGKCGCNGVSQISLVMHCEYSSEMPCPVITSYYPVLKNRVNSAAIVNVSTMASSSSSSSSSTAFTPVAAVAAAQPASGSK